MRRARTYPWARRIPIRQQHIFDCDLTVTGTTQARVAAACPSGKARALNGFRPFSADNLWNKDIPLRGGRNYERGHQISSEPP